MGAPQETASRILTDLAEIDAVAEAWRALEADCADPLAYFQSHDWCRNWIAQFAAPGRFEPFVQTLWRGGTLVAVWPLMIVHAAGLRRLETLGVPHTQYCGLLARPGAVPRAALADMAREAVARSGCDVAVLRAVPEGSALARALDGVPAVPGVGNEASMLDLSAYESAEAYTAGLGKLQKRNRNRRRNHLARLGALDFAVAWPGQAGFEALVRQCAAMKRQWLAETGRYSAGFAMAGYEDFLARLRGDADARAGAVAFVLRVDGRPVAIELGFLHHRHYYAYIGGFDWSLRELSPGKVQMDMTVGWLIDNGIASYDLLINPADYKASWSSHSLRVGFHARALSRKGALYTSIWLPRLRPALKKFAGRVPEMTQTALAVLRSAACLLLYV